MDLHVSRLLNTASSLEEHFKLAYAASQLYSKVGEFDKALSYIDMYLSVTVHHSDASAFYLRGFILEKKGRINDAISAYCNSLSLKPKQRDVIIKICEVVCSIERPPEDQLSKWLEQAQKVAAPPRLVQSLEEKLALAKGDAQTLERLYYEQVNRSQDDLFTYRKIVILKLHLSDLKGAKKLVDQMTSRIPQATENLEWIQVCCDVYDTVYTSFISVEGGDQQMEIYPLLSGMLGHLSSTFILKLSSDHKHPKETLRHFDFRLTSLYSALEKFSGNPAQRLPHQLRFKEYFAHFYQLCAYLLLKLAYDQVLDLSEMLQLAAVCLSISFSITPPSTRDESTEAILHMASSRMCEVGYLMAALTRLNGQEWLQRTVKPKISLEGISRIIEVLELQDTLQTPCCMRLHTIDISQVQCTSPSRNHLARYHEAFIKDHLDQLPFLTWLSLAEVSAYGGHPSLPYSFAHSEHRFKSFPNGCEDFSRTDYSSCSRMDIETFLYMSFYETQQLESTAESSATILLPIVLHKLSVPEARCAFWTSLIALDRAPQTNMSIKDACKYKLTVEKGLIAIRCLKKMELPTLIVYNIAEAFEQRLSDCSLDSPGYSEERQRLLVAMNKLYWTETLRRLEMIEAEVSSAMCDDSFPNCIAAKLLWVEEKNAVEGLSEERRKAMRSRAKMVQADLSLHSNQVLKALRIYENLELPPPACNHAQILKLVALSGNPAIISGIQPSPSTSYDLPMRSQKILSEWTYREEVKQDLQMKQRFETQIQSLDKSIQDHRRLKNSPEHMLDNFRDTSNACNVDILNSATFDQASAPSFSFPPQSAGLHSTPKRNIPGSHTSSIEEQQLNMQLQFERMSLALKQRDNTISDLSKENVELRGIVQNLQYYFTDQKVLFKNQKDPENSKLRPEDLDNLPTLQLPSTVHHLSGRNLSLSNNNPEYPFNNFASSNKSHTPLNRSFLESSYQGDLTSDLSSQITTQGANFQSEYDTQQTRPMLSVKSKPPFQFGDQTSANPFAHLDLIGTGSGHAAPSRVSFQLNLPASGSGPTEPGLYSSNSNKSFESLIKGNTSANSTDDFVCTADHDALVVPHLEKTVTGRSIDSEDEYNTSDNFYEIDRYFEPVVILPELKVLITGEEQEEVIFFCRAKLYRFVDKEWKERGIGELKILVNPETDKHRILMRRDVVKKLCCNHYITQGMRIQKNQTSELTMNWYTPADFSDEIQQPELLAAKFKSMEIAAEFANIFNQCRLRIEASQSPLKENLSFSSLVPSQTQTSNIISISKVWKSVNEDREDTGKPNVRDSPQIEEEKVLFCRRAALHIFVNFEWKQRGEGDLKLFHNQQTGEYKVEMRRDPGQSICCRHFITKDIKLGLLENDERTWIWDAVADLSQETPQNERFSARFKSPETANEFREVFGICQLKLMNRILVPIYPSTITHPADVVPDYNDYKTQATSSKNQGNGCQGAEHVPPSDNAELSRDDVIFVCAYEPNPAQIAITEDYQLPRYSSSYEDQPPSPGYRGCHDNSDIVYEKDSDTPEQPRATEDVESKLRDASQDDSTCELKQGRVKPSLFAPQVDGEIPFTKLAQSDVVQGFACPANPFKAPVIPLFAASSEEGGEPPDSEPDAHSKPIVQLPEIQDLRTGAEGEEELFNKYTVLFSLDENEWKERGRGDVKILYNRDTETRPMLSVKSKQPFQFGDQTSANPFAHLDLIGTGSGLAAPSRVSFQLNLPASGSGPTEPGLYSSNSNKSFESLIKGNTSANSTDDFVCTADHDSLVELPLVKTENWEESEDVLFCHRGKLFRYRDNKWVERGVGDMKVLQQRNEHKFRLLMQRESVLKLCCNHLIISSLELKPQTDRSVLWSTHADFSERTDSESLTLAILFKTPEIKDHFVEAVNKCTHILKHSIRLMPSPHESLNLASNASPQTLFEKRASLSVANNKTINTFGSVRIRIVGESDRANYRTILDKDGAVLFDHEIRDIGDCRQYAIAKNDKSLCWTLKKSEDQPKKSEFIVKFKTTAAAGKFHAIMQDCISKSRTHVTIPTSAHSEKIAPSTTPEKNSKSIFGMGALPGFTFSSEEHGKLFSSTPIGFMNLHSTPTPATDSTKPQASTSDNSYETDCYFEPVVVSKLNVLITREEVQIFHEPIHASNERLVPETKLWGYDSEDSILYNSECDYL